MVVTKAPSEPWEMVRKTLEAMLLQDVPHDTWLADEDPSDETKAWCADHGVLISSRKDIPEYHQKSWPRRTRCKEGNLAYFYDTYGYEQYDLVAQLDADHVPTPSYLCQILLPFHSPSIGYVAAPSICDNNKLDSWAARGRLYAEATLHGPLQAGYNDRWAPLCIGSHYAVRTQALKDIGGIGPELAEDHSTTLMMNAHGWQGAFQIDAIANGDGPATFADCMVQEFQWSRSLTMILFQWTPKMWGGLSLRHKAQFLFSQLWYPLFSSVAFVGFLVPIICLWIDRPIVSINYWVFMAFAISLAIANTIPALALKRFGCLRPRDARVISWEEPLFTITRFPWVLAGIFNGIYTVITRRQLTFRVTPKGSLSGIPLRTRIVAPYIVLSGMTSLAVIFIKAKNATGYYYLCLVAATICTAALLLVVFLHHWETTTKKRFSTRSITLSVLPFLLLIVAFSLRFGEGMNGLLASGAWSAGGGELIPIQSSFGDDDPTAKVVAPLGCTGTPCFGVHDDTGSFSGSGDSVQINHSFIPWGSRYSSRIKELMRVSVAQERIPMVTLEPWPWAVINVKEQDMNNYAAIEAEYNKSLLSDIALGKYDESIKTSLNAMASNPRQRVLVRLMHEMEMTRQYPWFSESPESYILAYRHVVELSRNLGFHHLEWIWSPVGLEKASAFWPGADYVDFVGISIYATPEWTWGHAAKGENLPLRTLVEWKSWIKRYGKPLILAEVGVNASPQDQLRWLGEGAKALTTMPEVAAWVYFNQKQPPVITLDIGLPDWSLSKDTAEGLMRKLESSQ